MRTRPDVTSDLDLPNGKVTLDEAGYLTDPNDWSPDFARHVAAKEDLEITDTHWEIIEFMRSYQDDHGVAADARFVLNHLRQTRNLPKEGAKHLLFELFPYGYVKQACKMAGMRQPRAWSTG